MSDQANFKVTLQPSGETFQVAKNEFILDAAIKQGLNLPHSCRGGSCGSCKSTITQGNYHYPNGQPWSLSEEEIQARECLLCQAHAQSDLVVLAKPIAAAQNIQIKKLPCRVEKMERLCHDVMAIYLKLPKVETFEFLAGQYIDIILADGKRRSFSIANPPHDAELLELHIRKVPNGLFTQNVFSEMKEKTLLRMEGPIGTFFVRKEQRRPIIMMGGGTGLAPLKGMLRDLLEGPEDDHGIHLFWGVRAMQDLYAHDYLLQMASKHQRFMYTPVLSEANDQDNWKGRTGWVHHAVLDDYPRMHSFDVYLAGPPIMINTAKEAFYNAGLPEEQLFYDSFDYAIDGTAEGEIDKKIDKEIE